MNILPQKEDIVSQKKKFILMRFIKIPKPKQTSKFKNTERKKTITLSHQLNDSIKHN